MAQNCARTLHACIAIWASEGRIESMRAKAHHCPMTQAIDPLEHAVDVLARAENWVQAGQRFALIASISIEGGTAREVGSLAVVSERGSMAGYLSNGCIDRDILQQGLLALEHGEARVVQYGEGSPFRDLRLPCGGSLTLLIDPAPDHPALMRALNDLRARRETVMTFAKAGADLAIRYAPKILLALAGRGAIFRAVAEVGHSAGFDLRLYSPDADDLGAMASLGPCTSLTTPEQTVDLPLDGHSAFLTLFHDHDWEPSLLAAALKTPVRFIGALGSARTQDQRQVMLRAMGINDVDCARVHGPIGLVPALRSVPLIALSSMAQLAGVFPARQAVDHATQSATRTIG